MICGLAILTVGILAKVQLSSVPDKVDTNVMFPSITLIVLGSIIVVISFFGCCGAIRESHCMTITFASFLLFILLVQVAVAVYAFVVVKNPENITEQYTVVFNDYSTKNESRDLVDIVQTSFACCGVNGPDDFKLQLMSPPPSCCSKVENETCSTKEFYQDGCISKIKKVLELLGSVLGGVAIGIAGVELIGIIFALCLANSIRNTERRGYRV